MMIRDVLHLCNCICKNASWKKSINKNKTKKSLFKCKHRPFAILDKHYNQTQNSKCIRYFSVFSFHLKAYKNNFIFFGIIVNNHFISYQNKLLAKLNKRIKWRRKQKKNHFYMCVINIYWWIYCKQTLLYIKFVL